MSKVTITRYRKGQLSVPYLYTPIIDTFGTNVVIRQVGNDKVVVSATTVLFNKHVQLGANQEVMDSSGAEIIASDNSGHVDQLGRVDIPLTTPEDSHEVVCSPSELVNVNQSGTLNEDTGYWETGADDSLYLFLGRVLNFKKINGTVVLDSIIIHYNTNHNNCYINIMDLRSIDVITGGLTGEVQDTDDYGNGTTGNENVEYEMNETLVTGKIYRMSLGVEATQGDFICRAVTIKYHVV